ncbi:MAG: leucine-rich repeat protein, partial [Oscillospiraceae bacterium]|nr:leucine-rich repeat protein [Oscillospiraceae bacterium]
MKKKILSTIMAFIMVLGIITIPESGFVIEAEASLATLNPVWPIREANITNGRGPVSCRYGCSPTQACVNAYCQREGAWRRSHHDGVDMGSTNQTVIAVAGGVVRVVRWVGSCNISHSHQCNCGAGGTGVNSYGNFVIIDHENGQFTKYAHLRGNIRVSNGQRVQQGAIIGFVGNTGNSRGAHLHFEVGIGRNGNFLTGRVDPLLNITYRRFDGTPPPIEPPPPAIETYTVTYYLNSSTSSVIATQTKTHGVALTLRNIAPTRTGYNFLGWATSPNATFANYQLGASYTGNTNLSLYPVWTVTAPVPVVPTGLSATWNSNTNVTLKWNATSSAVYYQVRFTNMTNIPEGSSEIISATTNPSYTITGLKPSAYYIFEVCAIYPSGTSNYTIVSSEYTWIYSYPPTVKNVNNLVYYNPNNTSVTIIGYTGTNDHVTIPSTFENLPVKTIGDNAFNRYITSITVPDSIVSIGNNAFYGQKFLTSVAIPDSVISIGDEVFRNCESLISVTMSNNLKTIGERAFQNCTNLESIIIPDSVISIGDIAFYGTNISSIIIPESVTSIGWGVFANCANLSTITIPKSVTNIGANAFQDCTNLTSVIFESSVPPTFGSNVFRNCSVLTDIYVPLGVGEKYRNIAQLSEFNIIEVDEISFCIICEGINKICSICGYCADCDLELGTHRCQDCGKGEDCCECNYITDEYETPDGYNDNDYQKLIAFFTQNANNRAIINELGWNLTDPETWNTFWKYSIIWNDESVKRVTYITLYDLSLSGTLDLSDFTALEDLWVMYNNITNLDISGCISLIWLSCRDNNLISLDVSSNTKLRLLDCSENNLTSLDVSKNTVLEWLSCEKNSLINLDVSSCTKLSDIACDDNNLTILDISSNTELRRLEMQNNNLTNIDVSNNTELILIKVDNNNLTSLKSLENLQNLKRVGAYYNYLDLSNADVQASISKIQATVDYNIEKDVDVGYSWWGFGFYYQNQKTNCSHDYGSWVTTKAATTSAAGERERTCKICGHVEKGTIAKLSSGGNSGGSSGGSSSSGGGGSSTPTNTTTTPVTPVTPTVTITTGISTWAVTNIPKTAFTALGISTEIPVNQIRIPAGTTGNQSVGVVGAGFAGQNAVLVQYNAEIQQLEFVSASTVGANGNANINVRTTGDFLVLTFKTGDITGTGTVETSDALALLRHVAGISELNSIQQFVA